MDGAWLTRISIPNSLRLHAPLTVVPTSHLYLHGRGQSKSNAGLTLHPSASRSCQYFTIPPRHPPLPPSTSGSSLYLLVSLFRVQTDDMEKRWVPTHSVTPTLTRPSRWRGVRRPVVRHTNHHGGTHVRIFSHTLFTKNNLSNIFRALSEGPRGSTPTFSNPSPNDTHLSIFPRLSAAILTKDFTQVLPTSNVTHTPTPRSDFPPRVTSETPLTELVYCVTVAFTMTERADQLYHDNAPANFTTLVQAFFWQSLTSPRSVSPPYSPDLAPCDFWLFSKLKSPLKERRFAIATVTQYTRSVNGVSLPTD